ncbi:MAG: monovalent cation/H(+) antiporter subunit G [Gammaproteobacteria bacterium]
MEGALDVLSWILIVIGSIFGLIGGLGIVRLPTFFTRIHAAGMTETMCAPPIVLAMMLQAGWGLVTFKLAAILMFLFLTSPTASHALAKAALHGGIDPRATEDPPEEDEG